MLTVIIHNTISVFTTKDVESNQLLVLSLQTYLFWLSDNEFLLDGVGDSQRQKVECVGLDTNYFIYGLCIQFSKMR